MDRWRAVFPESLHARLAKASILVHVGLVVRGQLYVQQTPPTSMRVMVDKLSEARPLLFEVLEADPENTRTASLLQSIGQWMGDDEAQAVGDAILAKHTPPETAFWRELYRRLPQWGGGRHGAVTYCREEAPEIEGVSVEECEAVVGLEARPRSADPEAALAVLQRIDARKHAGKILNALIELRRGEEALELVDRLDLWVNDYNARQLARLLRDRSLMVRFARARLKYDPYHPRYLLTYIEGLNSKADAAEVDAAIQKALVRGSTLPKVRRWEIFMASRFPDRRDRIFEIYRDALGDTSWHYDVIDIIAPCLGSICVEVETLSDGTPRPEQCDRHDLIAQLPDACAYWRNEGTYCKPKQLKRMAEAAARFDLTDCPK